MKRTILSTLFSLAVLSAFSQRIYTPAIGTPERKVLLNIIRTPTEKELGQAIQFTPSTFNIMGDMCFILANIQQANGKLLDIEKFVQKDLIMGEGTEAFFENNIQVVLKKIRGKWRIVRRVLGCTDVCWSDWYVDLKMPKAVFGMK